MVDNRPPVMSTVPERYALVTEYFEKAEKAEVLYCEDHDREFFNFEECPGCLEERRDFEASMRIKGDLENRSKEVT
jgi:hypothetical protein